MFRVPLYECSVGWAMCSFRFCRGRGHCFLEGVSPCSEHAADEVSTIEEEKAVSRRIRSMGLSRTGFVQSVLLHEAAFDDPFAGSVR